MHGSRTRTRRRRDGFTLVELMIVVAIIVLLLALALPAFNAVRDRANVDKAKTQMQMIAMAIDEYIRAWPAYGGLRDCDVDGDVNDDDRPYVNAAQGLPPWSIKDLWDWGWERQLNCLGNEAFDANEASDCLAWCLTAEVAGGPFLKKPPSGLLVFVDGPYPYQGGDSDHQVRRLLDPWGVPYFYCWKTADGAWIPFGRYVDGLASNELELEWTGRTDLGEEGDNSGRTFVLISAGPDKQFEFIVNPDVAGPDGLLGTPDDLAYGDDVVFGR